MAAVAVVVMAVAAAVMAAVAVVAGEHKRRPFRDHQPHGIWSATTVLTR